MICFKSIGSSVLAISLAFKRQGKYYLIFQSGAVSGVELWHKSNRYRFFSHRQTGTVWTEMPGTIKPKSLAQIEPN